MRELVDIRLSETWAQLHLDPTWGKPMPLPGGASPMVRQVVLETSDPRLATLKTKLSTTKSGMTTASDFREYEDQELTEAALLRLIITKVIPACAEDYGTVYDDSQA